MKVTSRKPKSLLSLRVSVCACTAGYVTELEKLDLSAVRLCFQVFLLDSSKKFSQVVPPVVSDPIVDKST